MTVTAGSAGDEAEAAAAPTDEAAFSEETTNTRKPFGSGRVAARGKWNARAAPAAGISGTNYTAGGAGFAWDAACGVRA